MKRLIFFIAMLFCLEGGISAQTSLKSPPEEFTNFIDSDLAMSLCQCDANLEEAGRQLNWLSSGKWVVYTLKRNIAKFKGASGYDTEGLVPFFRTKLLVHDLRFNGTETRLLVSQPTSGSLKQFWVNSCDVLLWSKPMTRNAGFPKRIITISQFNSDEANKRFSQTSYLQAPDPNSSSADLILGTEVLYIMLERSTSNGTYYLLSSSSNSSDLSTSLKGWIHESNVTFWDTRVAYWENHSQYGKQAYGDRCIPLVHTRQELDRFNEYGTVNNPISNDTLETSTSLNRMLRLEATDERYENVGSEILDLMTTFNVNKSGMTVGELNQRIQEFKAVMQQMNVFFLIDATASMQKNREAIKKGVRDFMTYIEQSSIRSIQGLKLSYHCAVYRGVEDGEGKFEWVIPRNSPVLVNSLDDADAFFSLLDEVEFYSSPTDRTLEEGLYFGMHEALGEHGFFNRGATNALIVLGDAGDDGQSVDGHSVEREEVLERLQEQRVDLIMLQTTNGHHEAFDSFVRDGGFFAEKIVESSNPLGFEELNTFNGWGILQTKVHEDATSLVHHAKLILNLNPGAILNPAVVGELLSDELNDALVENNRRLTEWQDKLKSGVLDQQWIPDGVNPEDFGFDAKMVRAYGMRHYYGEEREAFLPYVYLESEVLEDLKRDIDGFANASASKYFSRLQSFMLKYASRLLGLDTDDPELLSRSMEEVWQEAFNVPFELKVLGGTEIGDIATLGSRVGDSDLERDLEAFKASCNQFSSLVVDGYRYNMSMLDMSDKSVVYWIPGEYFPGMKGTEQ